MQIVRGIRAEAAHVLQVMSLAGAGLLTGCVTLDGHHQQVTEVQSFMQAGSVPAALERLEASAATEAQKQEMLFNLERAELLRLAQRYAESNEALLTADARVTEWESASKTGAKAMGAMGASLISERMNVYTGTDYEKVWLTTRLALNRMALGDYDGARVDIKRTHEREALIAELRAKDVSAAEAEAKEKGVQTQQQTLNGYPIETLEDPQVLALKNGYQNALSHYLAGYLYEALNEPSLAAPGYRAAIELSPNKRVLEESLKGLDQRTSAKHKRAQKHTDVLLVVEAGDAPARVPQAFTLPVPSPTGMITVSIAYPTISPSTDAPLKTVTIAGKSAPLEPVVDMNVMARRSLKDEMPGLVTRSITRGVAKGVVQEQLQQQAGIFGALVGMVASATTEQADDRMWRMLPGRVYLARTSLPPGEHQIAIDGQALATPVKVSGQYALVPLRIYGSQIYPGAVSTFGQLDAPSPKAAARKAVRPNKK